MDLRTEIAQFLEPRIKEFLKDCPPELYEDCKALHKAMEADSMGYGVDWVVMEKGLSAFVRVYKYLRI